jgi:hypothetical protein
MPPLAKAGEWEARSAVLAKAAIRNRVDKEFMDVFFMAIESRWVFTPLFLELDFWKMFFMSRDISSLPKTQ